MPYKKKYKSKLENDFAKALDKAKIKYRYEADVIPYVRPSRYIPDWKISDRVYLETKGEFAPAQRNNLLAFLEQHPDYKIIMVFANAKNKLNSKSKMTYGEWCSKHGIEYHDLQAVYNNKKKSYVFRNPYKL